MSEQMPRARTPGYFDYLLDSFEAEVRLSEYHGIELDSIDFYKEMLRAAYQQAMEQKEGDAGHAAES
jgi:hypothetical protein